MKYYLFLIFQFLILTLFGQDKSASYKKNANEDLYSILYKLQKQPHYFSLFCSEEEHSVYFTKFNINSNGNVESISCNNGTPIFILNFVKEGLALTNGNWQPALKDNKPVKSKPFILPIALNLSNGGEYNNTSINSVLNILNFEKDTLKKQSVYPFSMMDYLDCILLKPIYFFKTQGVVIKHKQLDSVFILLKNDNKELNKIDSVRNGYNVSGFFKNGFPIDDFDSLYIMNIATKKAIEFSSSAECFFSKNKKNILSMYELRDKLKNIAKNDYYEKTKIVDNYQADVYWKNLKITPFVAEIKNGTVFFKEIFFVQFIQKSE